VPIPGRFSLPADIDLIVAGAKHAEYDADHTIFRKGEPANQFFLIESGMVALEADGPRKGSAPIQMVGDGELLGWSWLFPPFTWHFSARAVKSTQAFVLNGGHLLVLCEENHDLGFDVMRRIAQIVISRMEATSKKLLE
jgi:CRP/FNR family transcriptional regulator, cyclic AMP receptor protein